MDQDAFLKAYLGGLARKMAPCGYDPKALVDGIWAGTGAMVKNDGSAGNDAVFWSCFSKVMGRDCRADEPIFEAFYQNEFQQVRQVCGYDENAAKVIAFLKEKGCRVALATNPLFPAIATCSRVRWAGLRAEDFELITTYENSRHCKPNPAYYQDILEALGEQGENCIMVGNDVGEDMVARDLGLDVFLLTPCLINRNQADIDQYPHGGFEELLAYLEEKVG